LTIEARTMKERKNKRGFGPLLRVGDVVTWRDGWGVEPPKQVRVTAIKVTFLPRSKEGIPAKEVPWFVVNQNKVIVDLDTGGEYSKWAYGSQISPAQEVTK